MCMRTYVVHVICNARVRVLETENAISVTIYIYSSVNVFIALGWHSENDYGLLINILTRTVNT